MQADQTVLSLRPGGGTGGGSRVFGPRFDSSTAGGNSDLPLLRPHGGTAASSLPSFKTGESRFDGHERIRYTRDQLMQLREVASIPDEILKVKQEVEAEFFGADPSWSRGENNVPNQAQTRYSEPDNRDWRNRSAQFTAPAEERSWEAIRDRDFSGRFDPRQHESNQYNKQDSGRAQNSSHQGVAPALIKAEVPWSARRATLSDKDRVLKTVKGMLSLRHSLETITTGLKSVELGKKHYRCLVQCAAKGPRPRYPRVWKNKNKIGTVSKSLKLVECIKGLSNVKEEVYGALDSFIAWELEFPLITVKKALKTLENEKDWKRIIQLTKWMLSKGQGRTMGSYYTLLNALAEDGRIDEAEELWHTLFSENLESMPRMVFERMISIYYHREMHDKMFEIFADMEELGMRPTMPIVTMVGAVFKKLEMLDKYVKLKKKYPPPRWEYKYIKGKRIKIRTKYVGKSDIDGEVNNADMGDSSDSVELHENAEVSDDDDCNKEDQLYLPETIESSETN